MFCTVLNRLKSPQNVGMIVRSHVAYGGDTLIFLGHELPWQFKKGSQSFSRKLEKQCNILHFQNDDSFFQWTYEKNWTTVALEVSSNAQLLQNFDMPVRTALIVGSEGAGLSEEFLTRCQHTVTIAQHGLGPSLNVAVASSICMYETTRSLPLKLSIDNNKFIDKSA